MTEHEGEADELPPSTVPADCTLSLRGFDSEHELTQRFQRAAINLIVDCGRYMDLSLLEGVTIGYDYDDALDSVDLGYESNIAKQYTKTENFVGVAKALRVKRDGQLRGHIVIRADVLAGLLSDDESEQLLAANILAHELGHVAAMAWLEDRAPGMLLSPQEGDYAFLLSRDSAHTIWEEYAACRLSAPISDADEVTKRYAEGVQKDFGDALQRAREEIKAYRTHHDVTKLLRDLIGVLGNSLKFAAYLAGHLDGTESQETISSLAPAVAEGGFTEVLQHLVDALRQAWASRHKWEDLDWLDGVIEALVEALGVAGADLTLDQTGQSRLDVPFTAETLPNGETDMIRLALLGLLKGSKPS